MSIIGAPMDRVDGPLKVCGTARYTAEIALPHMAHAVVVTSTIAKGRIVRIDSSGAQQMADVVAVLTHRNAMKLPKAGRGGVQPPQGRVLSLLQDDAVHYNGEPIAVVVAETLEQAVGAAAALRIEYEEGTAVLEFAEARARAHSPGKVLDFDADSTRGDTQAALASAPQRLTARYATPMQHHNPMEPHATLASWQGERLSLYDSTQYVAGVRRSMAQTFGLSLAQVRVRCAYVGGAFGGKGSAWSHVALAAMAARQAGRPVRLVINGRSCSVPWAAGLAPSRRWWWVPMPQAASARWSTTACPAPRRSRTGPKARRSARARSMHAPTS